MSTPKVKYLCCPIQVDGLFLKEDEQSVGPLHDFTKIPWKNGNSDKAYTSSNLTDSAFKTGNKLSKGLHLHWSFPTGLAKTSNIGLVYRATFLNVFGTHPQEGGSGINILAKLVSLSWLKLKDEQTGLYLASLPAESILEGELRKEFPAQAHAIKKLLKTSVFPPVPDRWLVTKWDVNHNQPIEQHLIESDYLWPEGDEGANSHSHSVFPTITDDPAQQPFRFQGRKYSLDQIPDSKSKAERLALPLTVSGYGSPIFSSFYPICKSVFGTHLPDATATDAYDIVGWYSNPAVDYYQIFVEDFTAEWHQDHQPIDGRPQEEGTHRVHRQLNYLYLDLLHALYRTLRIEVPVALDGATLKSITPGVAQEAEPTAWDYLIHRQWITEEGHLLPKAYAPSTIITGGYLKETAAIRQAINAAIKEQLPTQLICHARFGDGKTPVGKPEIIDEATIKVAIGNSPTEALSAELAGELSVKYRDLIEDQLEAIQFQSDLHKSTGDVEHEFNRLRHKKQFRAVPGGTRWRIRRETPANKSADQVSAEEQITLPTYLANELNLLNQLEQQRDRQGAAIGALRREIFADWCRYLGKVEDYQNIKLNKEVDKSEAEAVAETNGGKSPDTNSGGDTEGDDIPWSSDDETIGALNEEYGDDDEDSDDPDGEAEEPSPQPESEEKTTEADPYTQADKAAIDKQKERLEQRAAELPELQKKLHSLEDSLAQQYGQLARDLFIHQAADQLVRPNDVEDAPAIMTALTKPNNLGFDAHLLAGKTDLEAALAVFNDHFFAQQQLLPWPAGSDHDPEEYSRIKSLLQENNYTGSDYERALLQRGNRLVLEASLGNALRHRPGLSIRAGAAGRYWVPNDPVLHISGLDVSGRDFNQSADAEAVVVELPELSDLATLRDKTIYRNFLVATAAQTQKLATASLVNRWHPILMDWQAAYTSHTKRGHAGYPSNVLTDNYNLGATEYLPRNTEGQANSGEFYSNRTILTTAAKEGLRNRLLGRIAPLLYRQFAENNAEVTPDAFCTWLNLDPKDTAPALRDPDLPIEQRLRAEIRRGLLAGNDVGNKLREKLQSYLSKDSNNAILKVFFASGSPASEELPDLIEYLTPRLSLSTSFAGDDPTPLPIRLLEEDGLTQKYAKYLHDNIGKALEYYPDHEIQEMPIDYLEHHHGEVLSWYQAMVGEALELAVEIHAFLRLDEVGGLSQSLGGINQSFIMRQQAFQLPVSNPVPLEGHEGLAGIVRKAVLTANKLAPLPDVPFDPLRSGKLAISELALIDNFGRSALRKLDKGNRVPLTVAQTMTDGQGYGAEESRDPTVENATLPPRLPQGARLNFRWLAADSGIEEMNDHPASSPICGWVLPNNLDGSLMIYDEVGLPLGYVDQGAHWRVFPGNLGPVMPRDIENPYLRDVAQWLCNRDATFLSDFITVLDKTQEWLEPAAFAQHEAKALLLGPAYAIVRADLDIQLREPYAQNVSEVARQLNKGADAGAKATGEEPGDEAFNLTANIENVQIPVRVGEYHRMNDGLVGFWREQDHTVNRLGDNFYAVHVGETEAVAENLVLRKDAKDPAEDLHLRVTLAGNPERMTMLIDPRAPVHAATGLLPVKSLRLPVDQYAKALNNLQVAFLTAPLLSPVTGVEVSLPTEPGYDWNWTQLDNNQWTYLSERGLLKVKQLTPYFGNQTEALWQALTEQGWLAPIDDQLALIVAEDKRSTEQLAGPFAASSAAIDALLDRLRLRPFVTDAHYDQTTVLKEGWLNLLPQT